MTAVKSAKRSKKKKTVVFITADGKMRIAYTADKKTRLPVTPIKSE